MGMLLDRLVVWRSGIVWVLALAFAVLAGVPARLLVEAVLLCEGEVKPAAHGVFLQPAAEAPTELRIKRGNGRLDVNQGPHGVIDDGLDHAQQEYSE